MQGIPNYPLPIVISICEKLPTAFVALNCCDNVLKRFLHRCLRLKGTLTTRSLQCNAPAIITIRVILDSTLYNLRQPKGWHFLVSFQSFIDNCYTFIVFSLSQMLWNCFFYVSCECFWIGNKLLLLSFMCRRFFCNLFPRFCKVTLYLFWNNIEPMFWRVSKST